MFGHQISQAGLRVRVATAMIKILRGTGESERRAILSDMLGYNPKVPLVPKSGPIAASIFLAELEESRRQIPDTLGIE
jgi:hypothetical protein